jgi:hypothetical protein
MDNGLSDRHGCRIEYAIVRVMWYRGACTFDDLVAALPDFSWNQIFSTVDSMSRDGRLKLQHPERFGIRISLQRQAFQGYRQAV